MAEIVQPDREDSSSSSSSDCWECTTCLKSIPGIIWQCRSGHLLCGDCHVLAKSHCPTCSVELEGIRNRAVERIRERRTLKKQRKAGKRVKECEHSKEPQEDNKGKRSHAVRQRQEVNPESGRAYPALSAIVPKNSWVVLSICVALVAVLLVPYAGMRFGSLKDKLRFLWTSSLPEPSDASKSTIAVELKTPDLNSTDKSKTQSNNDAKGEDVPATISNSSNASSPTNSAQSGKEGSNQTQPVKPSPRWAELPVPRPLRLCSFQRDEVVDLDWTWVVMADAMGWAHQGPLMNIDRPSNDYGVWVCIYPEAIVRQPCVKYFHSGEPDYACLRYHEVKKIFQFWQWNFGDRTSYTPVRSEVAAVSRPYFCSHQPGDWIPVDWLQIEHLISTQRAFNGSLPPALQTPSYRRWACLGPHMVAVLHNRISVPKTPGLRKAPISEKMRPCVHWSPDQGIDHFIYDLLCMKYHEQDDEFHFWTWNSMRSDAGKVGYSKAYKMVRK
uniref:Uncharacterized protein n=1 Tax=Hanusia phi TaxID=3032 RepID=A0A6T7PI19_9CRYP|mmetsp:Transcript_20720/g.46891  ORF Transcript_20720/g.46891 Transcript_20720/m.46891 type:complete len:498 (+) Transcript_20720:95-1588(+)